MLVMPSGPGALSCIRGEVQVLASCDCTLSSTLETRGDLVPLLLTGKCHILVLQGAGINVCALL